MKHLKHIILLAAALMAMPAQAGYTPGETECLEGVVVVRTPTHAFQLMAPETGLPMECGAAYEAALKIMTETLRRVLAIPVRNYSFGFGEVEVITNEEH